MVRRRNLLRWALLSGAAGLTSACTDRSVAISAFSQGAPRRASTTAYFDVLSAELTVWLAREGYAPSPAPSESFSWSMNYPSQSDQWFASDEEGLRVMARRATSEVEALDVYVCVSVRGTGPTAEAIQGRSDERIRRLTTWWREYNGRNPLAKQL
jgi:hypothetical protein